MKSLLVVIALSMLSEAQSQSCLPAPTPMNFRELFISQCNDVTEGVDCTSAWGSFSGAFAGMPADNVEPSNYNDYLNIFPINAEPNSILFWSATPNLVRLLDCMCSSGASIQSSTNIPSNEILDGVEDSIMPQPLRWCGTDDPSSPDGIEYTEDCSCDVTAAFFEAFSIRFAQAARGTVFYLGYGERSGGTYSNTSFFSRFEVPNLDSQTVTDAVLLVAHRRGEGEYCHEGSLRALESALSDQGIPTSKCYNIFGDITDLNQLQSMASCAVNIITSIQGGSDPEPNNCFSTGSSGATALQVSVLMMVLSLIVLAVQYV